MDIWIRVHNYINANEDVLSGKWFLMASPVSVLVTSTLYLYAVIIILPDYMKNRKPFEFKKFLIFYNFLQVLLNIWLFYGLLPSGLDAIKCHTDKTERCNNGETSEQTKSYSYYFHLSKYTDLIDTIIFLLRKKYSQVSVLHVYHHSTMPFVTWISVKYSPCGRLTFYALLNSFVHIVMYTYYLLSAFGPKIRNYIWWKKYVTMCQMVQLILVSLHATQSTIYGCNVFPFLSVLNGVQSTIYLIMFWYFYKRAYKKDDIPNEIIGDCQEVNYKKYKTN